MEKLTVLGRDFEGTLTVKIVENTGIDALVYGEGNHFEARFTGVNCNFYGEGETAKDALSNLKSIAAASLITR